MGNKLFRPGEQFDEFLRDNPDCYIIKYPHGRARRYVPKPCVVYHDCVLPTLQGIRANDDKVMVVKMPPLMDRELEDD